MTSAEDSALNSRQGFLSSHPVATYFVLTYAISWAGAFLLVAPKLLQHEPVPKRVGLLMFPVMLLGPALASIILTMMLEGTPGLRDLFNRLFGVAFPRRWYTPLLIPPVVILAVLLCMRTFVAPVFTPNTFFVGVMFGIVAGFVEEIGWMGYAFPKMHWGRNALTTSISLGLLWSAWHLPVIDYLGTAVPHGAYWFRFLLAFTLVMTAMRVLIGWAYTNTKSVFLTQCMHASSTGALVVLSPVGINPEQELLWYAVYGLALWVIVAIVVRRYGKGLTLQSA
jgi:uncharacterized protein